MSPIRDLPQSFRRLGKIRLGEQLPVMKDGRQELNKRGEPKFRPAKLGEFRLTSPSRDLLEGAATVYGGEVRPWEGAPGEEDEWELYTGTSILDIVIPPGDGTWSQWYETWDNGGCQRRCDGVKEQISGSDCLCPADAEERQAEAAFGRACRMTTRLMVILPKIPDLGVWMLESHGWYAAVELGAVMEFLTMRAPGQFVNARLRLESRTVKRAGKTRHFGVPVIEFPQATAGELLSGSASAAALPPAAAEIGEVRAIEAGPSLPDPERVKAFVLKVKDAGGDDETRAMLVEYATGGRTSSSREVTLDEWPRLQAAYAQWVDGVLTKADA